VDDVVADVFETLRLLADQQGVRLRAEELDTLPLIMADKSRLFNTLYNLVINAIPEVPRDGSVTIHGRTDFKAKAVILSVADTGAGTTFYLMLPIEGPALSIAARLASDTSTTS
jgi:C4-dicarboxylate-specific signal transduction histidine kinase